MTLLSPLRGKVARGARRIGGTKTQTRAWKLGPQEGPGATPYPSGSACHLSPQGGKEDLSALYVGEVTHRRTHGFDHALKYRIFMLLMDLDHAEAHLARLRWLTGGRFGLLGFRAADHGDRSGRPLRAQVERHLTAAGIDIDGGPIRLLSMPRILGYGFNPLSVYFCHRPDGALAALLYEVTNTFHERHSYLVAHPREADPRLVRPPGEAVSLVVAVRRGDTPILTATFAGTRRPLTDSALLAAWVSHPLLTFKVMWGIHWEAVLGMFKGAKYRERGRPPEHPTTLGIAR